MTSLEVKCIDGSVFTIQVPDLKSNDYTLEYLSGAIKMRFPAKRIAFFNIVKNKIKVLESDFKHDLQLYPETRCGPCGENHDVKVCPLRCCSYLGCPAQKDHWRLWCPTEKKDKEKKVKADKHS